MQRVSNDSANGASKLVSFVSNLASRESVQLYKQLKDSFIDFTSVAVSAVTNIE
jgi:hypothetical protein